MASFRLELSTKKNALGESEVLIRTSVRRGLQPRIHSGVYIKPERLKNGKIKFPRLQTEEYDRLLIAEQKLNEVERALLDAITANPATITKAALQMAATPKVPSGKTFFDLWGRYLESRQITPGRLRGCLSFVRALHRFEIYIRINIPGFTLTPGGITPELIGDLVKFLREEHALPPKVTKLFGDYPVAISPKRPAPAAHERGNNFIDAQLRIFSGFCNWCVRNGLITVSPFARLENRPRVKYGKPYYLTPEERDRIAAYDLSEHPTLAVQRDIFIFQCLTGCRVSDLISFTPDNIAGGVLEYVARKTLNERADTIRVPLNPAALAIIARYKDTTPERRLLPFISPQKYNAAIKKIFTLCGIDRVVTIINPVTGKDERRPLNEIASSHIARRTFIGNLYKKVKDPNLVGVLSGHKEGSRAFVRYRDIDDDLKREIIGLL